MNKKKYQKATMKVVNVESEQHLLSASGPVGPAIMSGTSAVWSEFQ